MTDDLFPSGGPLVAQAPHGLRVWRVGALLKAVATTLENRFSALTVEGEICGFSRATSGHCYLFLKDEAGQLRCAMFRRAASLLDFSPRDGMRVEIRGRLGVFEPRGELQLVVEGMRPVGAGNLFEQFLRLKLKLETEGLFDAARKKPLVPMPRAIGVVTSLGAAALHDVITTLQRRSPHVPVFIFPASVQGSAAPAQLQASLQQAFECAELDVILLVRGGGAMEDLMAFNDEGLARAIRAAPVPVISGVGHETDFTIADFCADVRAATPTAAAELSTPSREAVLDRLQTLQARMERAVQQRLQATGQRLDMTAARLAKPAHAVARHAARLDTLEHRLRHGLFAQVQRTGASLQVTGDTMARACAQRLRSDRARLDNAEARLETLNPQSVLERGFAWLADARGVALTSAAQARPGQTVRAVLADGQIDLTVSGARLL